MASSTGGDFSMAVPSSKWPTSVNVFLLVKLIEAVSFYIFRITLGRYLALGLGLDDATIAMFLFFLQFLIVFLPMLGAYIAEAHKGIFRTIALAAGVYVLGEAVFVGFLFSPPDLIPTCPWLSLAAIVVLFTGVGLLRCVFSVFGAEQLDGPRQIALYFAIYYCLDQVGLLVAQQFSPLAESLWARFLGAEGALAGLFINAFIMLVLAFGILYFSRRIFAYHFYPRENIFHRIRFAIRVACANIARIKREQREEAARQQKADEEAVPEPPVPPDTDEEIGVFQEEDGEAEQKKPHFLDAFLIGHRCDGDKRCGYGQRKPCAQETFVEDVKHVFQGSLLLVPLALFWAFFGQQEALLANQAAQLVPIIPVPFVGLVQLSSGFVAILRPLFVALWIPILYLIVFPCFEQCCTATQLKRLSTGLFIAALAFINASWLQTNINATSVDTPASTDGMAHVKFVNAFPTDCRITVTADRSLPETTIPSASSPLDPQAQVVYKVSGGRIVASLGLTGNCSGHQRIRFALTPKPGALNYIIVGPQGVSSNIVKWTLPGDGLASVGINMALPCNSLKNLSFQPTECARSFAGRPLDPALTPYGSGLALCQVPVSALVAASTTTASSPILAMDTTTVAPGTSPPSDGASSTMAAGDSSTTAASSPVDSSQQQTTTVSSGGGGITAAALSAALQSVPPCRGGTNVFRWDPSAVAPKRSDSTAVQAQMLTLPPRGDNMGQGRTTFYPFKTVPPGNYQLYFIVPAASAPTSDGTSFSSSTTAPSSGASSTDSSAGGDNSSSAATPSETFQPIDENFLLTVEPSAGGGSAGVILINVGLDGSPLNNQPNSDQPNRSLPVVSAHVVAASNNMIILWLVPGLLMLTLAEVLICVTGLEFCFNEVPLSLKASAQAYWYLMIALGYILALLFGQAQPFTNSDSQLLFAGVVLLVIALIFAASAYFRFEYAGLRPPPTVPQGFYDAPSGPASPTPLRTKPMPKPRSQVVSPAPESAATRFSLSERLEEALREKLARLPHRPRTPTTAGTRT